MNLTLEPSLTNAVEEMRAVLLGQVGVYNPLVWYARLADLGRSNSFLWTQSALRLQMEMASPYLAPPGQGVSRSLVVASLVADLAAGYATLYERNRWLSPLVQPEDWHLQHQRGANRVLETAISMGGAMIKACQFASTRPDLLPPVYIHTLLRLQDRMPPRDWPEIEQAIAGELNMPLSQVFAEIEETPVAAASIAQVHRARLLDGRPVAVKVQYPDVAELVSIDLVVLDWVVKAVVRLVPAIQLQPIVDYLKWTLPLELDFVHEAEAMVRLRDTLRHRTDAVVPEVIRELSTRRLIVMELMDGIKITDKEAIVQAGISPHEVAEVLNDLYGEQMMRQGFVHADPHPGNLLVQPGPRIVLLDHGLTMPLAPALAEALRKIVRSLANGDLGVLKEGLVEAGLRIDESSDDLDVAGLLQLVGVLLGREGAGEEVEAGGAGPMDTGVRFGKSIGAIPVDLLLVGRLLGLLDGITRQLDPEIDAISVVAHYA